MQSYRRKLLDGLVTSLALELTAATRLLNSLKVRLTTGVAQILKPSQNLSP